MVFIFAVIKLPLSKFRASPEILTELSLSPGAAKLTTSDTDPNYEVVDIMQVGSYSKLR